MKKKAANISPFHAVVMFFALYPVMNAYIRISGIQIRLVLILATVMILFIVNGKKIKCFSGIFWVRHIMIVWSAVLLFVAVLHNDIAVDFQKFLVWFILPTLIIPVINSKKRFLYLVKIVVYVGGIVAILGVVEEFTHVNVFQLFDSGEDLILGNNMRMGILRIQSFASHPITYCAYCMFVLSLNFYLCSLPEYRGVKVYKITYALIFFSAVLTLSRSTIIGIFLSQILLLWMSGYKTMIKRIFCIMIGIALGMLVVRIALPTIWEYIQVPLFLVGAVFNNNYSDVLRSLGYAGDTTGVAERFILWRWVWEDTQNNVLLGHGPSAWLDRSFINSGGYVQSKNSIEVQVLMQYFRYGIFAAMTEVVFYLSLIVSSFKQRSKVKIWEGKVSFPKVYCAVFLSYFLVLFAVTQNETIQIFFVTTILYMCYVCNYRKIEG